MKLTKVIATIGPSCEDPEIIEKLIKKGANTFRFNFKHNTVEWHEELIQKVRSVADKLDIPVGTLIDLQGPEIRLRLAKDLKVIEGQEYSFGEDPKNFDISLSHVEILSHLKDGQIVIADDGAFRFKLKIKNGKYFLIAESSGTLIDKKGLNIPGGDYPVSVLVDRDFEGIKLAQKYSLDYVALSFVRTKSDIEFLKKELKKIDAKSKIVSKIETQKAIENLDDIVETSDIVMVARGDLGVEFPLEQVPYLQKKIIKSCVESGKAVIIATQMLESMIENPYPTRAEISDIANGVYDHTDAVMLSAETASGAYPSKAVSTMSKAVIFNETTLTDDIRMIYDFEINDQTELLCDSAYNIYETAGKKDNIAGFVVFTETGRSAATLSRYRAQIPIFAFTPTPQAASSLTVNFGVCSIVWQGPHQKLNVVREDLRAAIDYLKSKNLIEEGQKIVALYGDKWTVKGGLSTIKIMKV